MIGNKIDIDILLGAPKLSFYDRAEIVHRYNNQPELLTACKKAKKVFSRMKDCGRLQADGIDVLPTIEQAIVEAEKI